MKCLLIILITLIDISSAFTQQPQLKISTNHNMEISGLAYSNDGKYIASASWDFTVKIWDAKLQKEIKTLKGHKRWVLSVMFSPDSKHLLSSSTDGSIILWDIFTGEIIHKLEVPKSEIYPGEIYSACFSPDGKYIIAGYYSDSNNIKLWNVKTGNLIKSINNYKNRISYVCYSPDGKYFFTNGDDSSYLYDASTYQKLTSIGIYCRNAHFTNDSKNILLIQMDGYVYNYNIESKKEDLINNSIDDYIHSSDISKDNGLLVLGSEHGCIYLFDLLEQKLIKKIKVKEGEASDEIFAIKFSPDSKTILFGGRDKKLYEIRTESFYQNNDNQLNIHIIGAKILPSKSGKKIILQTDEPYSAYDTTFTITILNTGSNLLEKYKIKLIKDQWGELAYDQADLENACFTSDEEIVAIADEYGSIYIYNLIENKCIKSFSLDNFYGGTVTGVKFTEDNNRLICKIEDGHGGHVSCYSSTGDSLWTYNSDGFFYHFLEFDKDGNILTISQDIDSVFVIDVNSGNLIRSHFLGSEFSEKYIPFGISEDRRYIFFYMDNRNFVLVKFNLQNPNDIQINNLDEITWYLYYGNFKFKEFEDNYVIASNAGIYIYSKDLSLVNKIALQEGLLVDLQITEEGKIIAYFDYEYIAIFDISNSLISQTNHPFDAYSFTSLYLQPSISSSKLLLTTGYNEYLLDYTNDLSIKAILGNRNSKFIDNGRFIYSELGNGYLGIYSANNFELLEKFEKNYKIDYLISNDGEYLESITDTIISFYSISQNRIKMKLSFGKYEHFICQSPDNKYLFTERFNMMDVWSLNLYNIKKQKKIWSIESKNRLYFQEATITYNNQLYMLFWDSILVFDINRNKFINIFKSTTGFFNSMYVSPDNTFLVASDYNKVILWDLKTGIEKWSIIDSNEILSVCVSGDKQYIITGGNDGSICFRNIENGEEIIRIYTLGVNDYIILHPSGLFDATPGAMSKMYYVQGLDIIEFNQLKDRYWEPGLLRKVLNGEDLRETTGFNKPLQLSPSIENMAIIDKKVVFDIVDKGGGIGKYMIYINGKEVFIGNINEGEIEFRGEKQQVSFDINNHIYLVPGKENIITAKAYNLENYIISREAKVVFENTEDKISNPNIFIVSCGISDYTGDKIDLRYAAKDAEDISFAMSIGAKKLFGVDKTYNYLLSTNNNKETWPTKKNIYSTFEEISKIAQSTDIIVVYLSGHGINWGGQEGDFYYLTQEAFTANIEAYSDQGIRNSTTISSNELIELFKKIPANKQVLIIDACASGQVVEDLLAKRDISSNTTRALDRMKDRTGMFIITGSAADAVSYEASKYGQGLLTYSLLEGIKGTSLREGKFIDVDKLFQSAKDRVPVLAEGIGGIQEPQLFFPYSSSSFDIGFLEDNDKKMIPLSSEKPVFVMSTFMDQSEMIDVLGLESLIDDKLRELSLKGKDADIVFYETKNFPNSYKINGLYSTDNNKIKLKLNIFSNNLKIHSITISGSNKNIDLFIDKIIDEIFKQLELEP